MNSESVVLAIESAIAGGSMALMARDQVLAARTGSSDMPRAEDLLYDIDQMLTSASIARDQIDLIAVSAGPGSFTGIRICIATALGLRSGLQKPMASVSALLAIAAGSATTGRIAIAVPMGRRAACVQIFIVSASGISETTSPVSVPFNEIPSAAGPADRILVHPALVQSDQILAKSSTLDPNIAVSIGRYCVKDPTSSAEPIFVSKSF